MALISMFSLLTVIRAGTKIRKAKAMVIHRYLIADLISKVNKDLFRLLDLVFREGAQKPNPKRKKDNPGPNSHAKMIPIQIIPARPKFLTCETSQIAKDPSPIAVVIAANRQGRKTVLSIKSKR